MSRELLIALDLGTTGVRALVVGPDGGVRSRAYRPLAVAFPEPGRVEQDPAEFWDRSLEVMREALGAARVRASDAAGIGVVTQRATIVAWDGSTGQPLVPAISWQDQRTSARVAAMRAAGIPINTLASATKLEWWMQNVPALQKAANSGRLRLGTPDSWLTSRLTGGAVHVTDPGHASCTALYDPAGGDWAPPLCDLFGVPAEALPQVVPTSAVVGETPEALLGAPLAVAARAGDQQAAAFGQGVHRPGAAKLTLGTSAMLDLHTGDELAEPAPGTYPLALWTLADGARAFCLEGTVITAGAAVDWLVALSVAPDAAAVDRMAGSVASAEGVVFVPALQGLGTPLLDDTARGLLLGLTRGSGVRHVARAVLEGVAQRCVDVAETLGVTGAPLCVDGGLARADFLMQCLADLSGCEIQRADETETTALGAAYLAGLAVGVFATPAACRAALAPPTRFAPALGAAARRAARRRWAEAVERARTTAPEAR